MNEHNRDARNLAIYDALVTESRYNWDDCDFLLEYLGERIKEYIEKVTTFDGYVKFRINDNKEILTCLSMKIIEATSLYMRGKTYAAYKAMEEAIGCINEVLVRKSAKRITTGLEFGFRARVMKDNDNPPISREDMFHIPFEKRHLVSDQRFSVHGLPSIYLGRSIYDCYVELGCPSLDKFFVSLFIFIQDKNDVLNTGHIKLIDLTFADNQYRIPLIWNSVKKDDAAYMAILDSLVDDILLWPLIFACSVVCKEPAAPFKQEYIIPQMLYQYCNEKNEFTGVRYYSTKIANNSRREKLRSVMINYALPTQAANRSGYCPKLASELILSEPICVGGCQTKIKDTQFGWTDNGFPVISGMHSELGEDDAILACDRATSYFDNLAIQLRENKDINAIKPLAGWAEEMTEFPIS